MRNILPVNQAKTILPSPSKALKLIASAFALVGKASSPAVVYKGNPAFFRACIENTDTCMTTDLTYLRQEYGCIPLNNQYCRVPVELFCDNLYDGRNLTTDATLYKVDFSSNAPENSFFVLKDSCPQTHVPAPANDSAFDDQSSSKAWLETWSGSWPSLGSWSGDALASEPEPESMDTAQNNKKQRLEKMIAAQLDKFKNSQF